MAAASLIGMVGAQADAPASMRQAIERGVQYLATQVPKWPAENRCFSCHNSGDGASALFLARRFDWKVPESATAATANWLEHPESWNRQAADAEFHDPQLATLQFSLALLEAIRSKTIEKRKPLQEAAELLINFQRPDGAWQIDQTGLEGSPITYGNMLATATALDVLRHSDATRHAAAITKARNYLLAKNPHRVVDVAAQIIGLADDKSDDTMRLRRRGVNLLLSAQDDSGGWGPYTDYQPQIFDTAMALIALSENESKDEQYVRAIQRGQIYLISQQLDDGSWPETTRPAGHESYAHRVSTTAWAVTALLKSSRR